MRILLDVTEVAVQPGYALILRFENGELRRFDMSPYMNQKPWNKLKDSPLFYLAKAQHGTVVWPGEIDIDPETLYERSRPLETASPRWRDSVV